MAEPLRCACCSAILVKDDIALTRKMVNRGTDRFLCVSCLASHFELNEDILRKKIIEFKAMGCTLFQ